jgi:hypothetical protein
MAGAGAGAAAMAGEGMGWMQDCMNASRSSYGLSSAGASKTRYVTYCARDKVGCTQRQHLPVIRGPQRSSEVIRGNIFQSSEVIRGHQRSSEATSSNHHRSSETVQWPLVALGSNHRQSRLLSHLPQVTRGGGANN